MTSEHKKEYMKKWRLKNKERIKEYHAKWRQENREHINEITRKKYHDNPDVFKKRTKKYLDNHEEQIKQKRHEYKIKNRKKLTEYEKKKREEPLYRMKVNIRTLIKNSIKNKNHKVNSKTEEILGCPIDAFIDYLKSKFQDGMTIESHGLWHIDHIIPISSAKTYEEIIKLNHYTNLQPLWAIDNLKKGNKIM